MRKLEPRKSREDWAAYVRGRGSTEQRGCSGVQTCTALSVSRLGKSAAAWPGLIVVYLEVSLELVYH